jgi:hypothetical protein
LPLCEDAIRAPSDVIVREMKMPNGLGKGLGGVVFQSKMEIYDDYAPSADQRQTGWIRVCFSVFKELLFLLFFLFFLF